MPWMVIMTLGYVVHRGHFSAVDLQVFKLGMRGGAYWFENGVNWRGMAAWIPAAVSGLLFANYPPLIEGPFRNAAGGVDISLPVSIGLAALIYVAGLFAYPEPRYPFGPDGPAGCRPGTRWFPRSWRMPAPPRTGRSCATARLVLPTSTN